MAVRIKKSTSLEVLNMTPIINVVFQLLLFFLVATRFAAEDRELDVMLPAASEAKPLMAQPQEMFVNIDHQGRYFIHGKIVSGDKVAHVLHRAAADNPANQSVIIRADKRVQLDHAVFVMNACNQAGIFDYTLTTAGQETRGQLLILRRLTATHRGASSSVLPGGSRLTNAAFGRNQSRTDFNPFKTE